MSNDSILGDLKGRKFSQFCLYCACYVSHQLVDILESYFILKQTVAHGIH